MLKTLIAFATILLISSCGSKERPINNDNNKNQTAIEDKSKEQNNYQSVSDEDEAVAMDEQTQKEIEEIEVQDRVFFGFDSATLSSEAQEILNVQAQWLKSDTSINITIEGHCDQRGTREYNIALGEKRALSAKEYLVANGIDSSRIKTISYGKERPAFLEASESAWSKNRRAVVVIN